MMGRFHLDPHPQTRRSHEDELHHMHRPMGPHRLGLFLLLAISLTVAYSQPLQFPDKKKPDEKKPYEMPKQKAPSAIVKLPVEAGAVEVAFTDGSNLKMQLREEKIALATPHGKLHIAVSDVQRIELATRVSDEDAKQIEMAIADLGSDDFGKREAASARLLKLRERAYPALLRAAGQNDPETVRRARELIQQITASVPADRLAERPNDVVYTSDSMIAGRIEAASLRAHTSQFGSVQVKLADVRSLRSPGMQTGVSDMRSTVPEQFRIQMEMEALRRQAQQLQWRERQMNKGWEKK